MMNCKPIIAISEGVQVFAGYLFTYGVIVGIDDNNVMVIPCVEKYRVNKEDVVHTYSIKLNGLLVLSILNETTPVTVPIKHIKKI